ncbi:MAG: 16S rRNA processing protein RimM [Chitinophagaceae bacterium]|nr:MAG: 16S rRNA processing protein RimM [Chitinophagaceae bacterium]
MEYFRLGKLVASFGLKGELILSHSLGKKSSLKGLQAVFTEDKKNSFLPWFIEGTRIKNDEEVYLKLETIDTKEAAMRLTRKELWIPEPEFKKLAAKSAPVSLLGYNIFNGKDELGEILEIIEQPHQILCRIEIQGKEVLIPLHEETLEKVDHKNKKVVTTLPDGLLEIYLG